MTIRRKLTISGLLATIIPMLMLMSISLVQTNTGETALKKDALQKARKNQQAIVAGVIGTLTSQQEVLEQKLLSDLAVVRDIWNRTGTLQLGARVEWEAINQFSREKSSVMLPRLQLGNTWLGQISDTAQKVPVVDAMRNLVGSASTIFQRMNSQGDMLRIASSVRTLQGKRAIGTYIPVREPDGRPNPIVETVLRGQRFVGRAFVVDRWHLAAYEPILAKDGEVLGIISAAIPIESAGSIRRQIMQTRVGQTGYAFVLDSKGNFVISPHGKRDGENIMGYRDASNRPIIEEIVEKAMQLKPGEYAHEEYSWQNPGDTAHRDKSVSVAYFAPWDWIVVIGSYNEEFLAGVHQIETINSKSRQWMILAFFVIAAVILFLWLGLAKSITQPMLQVSDLLRDIAQGEGDLTRRIARSNKDEMGELSANFDGFVEKIQGIIREIADNSGTLASSSTELSAVATQLNEGTQSNRHRSASVATAAEEMSATTAAVSGSMEQASQGMSSVSSATEQMSITVSEVARQAERARGVTTQAARQALDISTIMNTLAQSAQEIGTVTEVISSISAQTNLLALNATIEAASAGEAGKGFAVVASEVKDLARQTAKATGEIQLKIEAIQGASGQAMTDMKKIQGVISETQEIVSTIASAIEQQAATTQDIARNISRVNQEVLGTQNQVRQATSVSQTIASDIATVHQTANAMSQSSEQVTTSSLELSQLAEQLRSIVGRFKV